MRPTKRTFVVEYKTSRRQSRTTPPSIWGNLDLQAVARQIESDGVLVRTSSFDPQLPAVVTTQVVEAAPALQEQAPAGDPVLGDVAAAVLNERAFADGLREDLSVAEVSAKRTKGRRIRRAKAVKPLSAPSKPKSVNGRDKVDALSVALQRADDKDELKALDAENRQLRLLLSVKLREENQTLRSMLCRFGVK
ncbi:hypothetical protein G6L13_25960 [Agrobacterium tumefaciens]|uniref:hypothetical protein n=1 Tax=Agrobacterium tumefaciens TaxID=358 RepID=UPI001574ECB6|nr:hypothetical protein [Agrobacterium tumefaciens]NTA83932.1 hypothetical protein [Agrobacterium tumefaciens]